MGHVCAKKEDPDIPCGLNPAPSMTPIRTSKRRTNMVVLTVQSTDPSLPVPTPEANPQENQRGDVFQPTRDTDCTKTKNSYPPSIQQTVKYGPLEDRFPQRTGYIPLP